MHDQVPPLFRSAFAFLTRTNVRLRRGIGGSFRARQGVITGLAAVMLTLGAGHSLVRASDSGIYGGGPFYKSAAANITEIKNSGFTEAIVWNIAVNTSGDLNFNYEFLLCSGGAYVGSSTHADFPANMAALKQGKVTRLTFCIGSSNTGVFQAIESLVNSQGTGATSILYKNFQALKSAVPSVDAIDFDDENCYDQSSMVQFAVMLGNLGYKVSLCPYTNSTFWTGVASQVNTQRAGTIDRVHLQCYSGGSGNSPNSTWNFGTIPVEPGLWDSNYTPSGVQTQMTTWKNQYKIVGGWMWLYDDFVGNGKAAQYASAINTALVYAPTVTSAATATATAGVAFSYQITAANAPTSYNASGLPAWLSVSTTSGVISGTPPLDGTFSLTVSATNTGGTGSASLAITVQPTFAAWQKTYFTAADLNNPAISGTYATPAGDGIPNLTKYALGLDPKASGISALPTISFTTAGSSKFLTLTYNRWLAASDVVYVVEVSGDLQTWSSGSNYTATVSAVNNTAGTMQTVVQRDLTPTSSAGQRFIRLRINRP